MRRPRLLDAAVCFFTLSIAAIAQADEIKLNDLFAEIPNRCSVVWGIGDVPATVAELRRWSEPTIAGILDETQREMVNWTLETAGTLISGPAAGGVFGNGDWLFAARTARSKAEIAERLNQHLDAKEENDLIKIGAPNNPWFFCAVRGGRIVGSNKMEVLDEYLSSPVEPGEYALGTSEESLPRASVVALKRAGVIPVLEPSETGRAGSHGQAFMRRLYEALGMSDALAAPGLLRLSLLNDSLVLRGSVSIPALEPKSANEPAGQRPGLVASVLGVYPIALYASGAPFAPMVDEMERGMNRFDPDVAAEFREEMRELNGDLGYDFQKDFLALLGPEWAVGVVPPKTPEEGAQWFFACGISDRERFVNSAARLAEISEEPWTEIEPHGAVRLFRTRAFTVPVEIAVAEDAFLMASSEPALESALRVKAADSLHPARAEDARWEVRLAAAWSSITQLFPNEGEWGRVWAEWSKLSFNAACVVRRLPDAISVELRLEGIDPEQIRAFFDPFSSHADMAEE